MHVEKITWGGWNNCYRLTNDTVELIVTADVGPRIISCALLGGENLFHINPEMLGRQGDLEWLSYGGHRFWLAPEHLIRTYQADNFPVTIENRDSAIAFTSPPEISTGMQKTLIISMKDEVITVTHHLQNLNLWDVECSLWGLSVMKAGGVSILPLPPRGEHGGANLLPNNRLALWAYTDMTDPRWTWGRDYILLRQDAKATQPQKIGASVPDGWLAYVNDNTLFLKQIPYIHGANYPDNGCNTEIFTNAKMLEVESLSPLQTISAGATATHTEIWHLVPDIPAPDTEENVRQNILPAIAKRLINL